MDFVYRNLTPSLSSLLALSFMSVLIAGCAGKGSAKKVDKRPHYQRDTGSYAAKPPEKPAKAKAREKNAPPRARTPARETEAAIIRPPQEEESSGGITQIGSISFYGRKFHGRKTASGEKFNMHDLTAAHPKLPFGTRVKVTNLSNGKTVTVRINDRGPFAGRRILDVSRAAAEVLGMVNAGVVRARLEVL